MAAPETPRRSLFGRLVGTLTQYVPTPRRTPPLNNQIPQATQPATTLSPAHAAAEAQTNSIASDSWHPGMVQSKYLLEYENMFADMNTTPLRRPVRRAQTSPPKRRNTRANAVEMPRSAMKKRSAPMDDEEQPTPSNSKRVKFNEALVQERILSPPHPGERDSVPEQRFLFSKKRPRATDPYSGKQFADKPNMFDESPSKRARQEDGDESRSKRARYETGEESSCDSDITPTTKNNTRMNKGIFEEEEFVPNRTQPRPGTFELNYDTYADEESLLSEERSAIAAPEEQTPAYNPPSATTTAGRFALEYSDDSVNPDTSSLVNVDTTPTPGSSKPPTRAASPPPSLEPSTTQNEAETTDAQPPTPPPNAAEIDAEMNALPWPKPVTYVDAGIASQHIINLLNARYDEEDEYYAGLWWDREYPKYTNALKTAKKEGREIEIEF